MLWASCPMVVHGRWSPRLTRAERGSNRSGTKGEGYATGEAPEYRFFSPDLSLALLQPDLGREEPLEQPPLSPEATEKTLYVRHNSTCGEAPSTCYEPLVTPADDTAKTKFGTHLEFAGASPGLGHVVFASDVSLLSSPVGSGLYEWESAQPLKLVSILPGGTPGAEPRLGSYSANGMPNVRHAISEDGTRVFWSEGESEPTTGVTEPEHLYLRDTAKEETLELDAAQGVPQPEVGESVVRFQTASADGSK